MSNSDGSGLTRVTNDEGEDQLPTFSPDGTRLAFQRSYGDNFDITTIGVDGTGEKRLTKSGSGDYGPAWSPDGRYIAFQSGRGGSTRIFVLDVAEGGASALTTGELGQDYVPDWRGPAASPAPAPPAP